MEPLGQADQAVPPPPPLPPDRRPLWLIPEIPQTEAASWLVTGAGTLLAAATRLSDLSRAPTLIFDETYYVKDAWSLWKLGYEGEWPDEVNQAFVAGDTSALETTGSFIVHPPVGKWLIGLGMQFFRQSDPVGWRIAAALMGIIGVMLVCRLAWRLFGSIPVTLLAGLFLATDGVHVVMSRTGLLDVFVGTFVLAAFLALVRDQAQVIPRIRAGTRYVLWRPWLLATGLLLGLACATKWSAIYAVAVIGLLVVYREIVVRAGSGEGVLRSIWRATFPGGVLAFVYLVVVSAGVYIASWAGWLLNTSGWGHRADDASLSARFADLLDYHRQMWDFHTGLDSDHPYKSAALDWMLQLRPTSFWFEHPTTGCRGDDCASAIMALGNPLLWWAAIPALLFLLWYTVRRGSWPGSVVIAGFLAMYVPWLLYPNRTVFNFYTVAFAPFVALAVAWALGEAFRRGRWLRLGAALVTAVILASAVYFAPVWTGWPIPYDDWYSRMWLGSWI